MSENAKAMWKQIFQGVLLLVIGLSLGFGSSQQFVVSQVKAQEIEIQHLKNTDEKYERRFDEIERIITTRITAMAGLVEKNMEQTSELITIIRTERAYHNSRNP
jgi:hypothetical protein